MDIRDLIEVEVKRDPDTRLYMLKATLKIDEEIRGVFSDAAFSCDSIEEMRDGLVRKIKSEFEKKNRQGK